ncbi:hypothetical protein CAOG_08907 [Capsaspora owczarzaki ATCC 30864]|uniref:Chalcone isomerase domain-containing protein n=1 Tax=Capsaspora owczarzaki (strain ATCC 30864) TaxID=595528 RepID=A0A0D2WSJ4_CAPO3|nr:hypothetical protein CAOG_08907 [Capsaspora owczarzaki ATCC 30864]KJE95140.1 hypothetical protein CAOG_008907 [Capsaspora owczarzaki ATCC 30864]|eukprot:XP_011270569.1 hypothetical protein CAOG_08907 [Capsaspora owczarzaki ATCC 30864]
MSFWTAFRLSGSNVRIAAASFARAGLSRMRPSTAAAAAAAGMSMSTMAAPAAAAAQPRRMRALALAAASGFAAVSIAAAAIAAAKREVVRAEPPNTTQHDTEYAFDKSSGARFPTHLTLANTNLALVGTGVRTVTFLQVQVYAIGLYVPDSAGLKLAIQRHRDQLVPSTAAETLINLKQPLSIRLVAVRNPDIKHLREALGRAMAARLKHIQDPVERAGAQMAVDQFKALFPQGKIAPGDAVDFVLRPDGVLQLSLRGESLGTVASKFVQTSILDTYIGASSVSLEAQRNFLSGLQAFASQ